MADHEWTDYGYILCAGRAANIDDSGRCNRCGQLVQRPAEPDLVNHPPHYTSNPSGVECIDVTEHMNFNLGNAVKYIWRADLKEDALEDLKKARWYVEREIARREKESSHG